MIGVNVKQYWFFYKYRAVSFFSSASSSFSVILGWGKDKSLGLDVHTIASGVDINIIRFNRFDIGLSAGIFAGGSFIQMKKGTLVFLFLLRLLLVGKYRFIIIVNTFGLRC